jgi:hypothetical protein
LIQIADPHASVKKFLDLHSVHYKQSRFSSQHGIPGGR